MPTPLVQRFLDYLNASVSPFHAVEATASRLDAEGFVEIPLGAAPRQLAPGAKAYIRRDGSIIAFRIGTSPTPEAGFRIVAAHTDSPNLRIKPQPYVRSKGYVRLGLEPYGGVLLATWPDRDLGIAGRVVYRDGDTQASALVHLDRPLCRIPNLAIHLNRKVNDEGLKLNKQRHLPALLSLSDADDDRPLHTLLSDALDVDPDRILAWDLGLYDLTSACLSGANDEFLHSARLDNLASCHAGLEGLVAAAASDTPAFTSVLALFDHEEVGSTSVRGARSRLLEQVLAQACWRDDDHALGGINRALLHSVLLSADMAHAVHPAYTDRHDEEHMPHMNQGPVIKQHTNQRYGTEADTASLFIRMCERADAPYQWYANRSDLACGSTVGPLIASNLGVATVDVGNAMLSMHSAREMCGTHDQRHMAGAMAEFWARA